MFLPSPVYTAPYSQVVEQTPSTVVDRGSDLARELERLTDEVERLREEQETREPARLTPLPRRPSAEENVPTTILVFRDGHRSEVRNYAIVGSTLWVFTEQRARKIPVSDLDVEATKKVNSDRGRDSASMDNGLRLLRARNWHSFGAEREQFHFGAVGAGNGGLGAGVIGING